MILCSAQTLAETSVGQDPCVYVLECERGHWYIGFSRWPRLRIDAHFEGKGAVFTQEHRPIRVYLIRPARDEFDEYTLWREYAEKHGRQFVGGYNEALCQKFGFPWPFQSFRGQRTFRRKFSYA